MADQGTYDASYICQVCYEHFTSEDAPLDRRPIIVCSNGHNHCAICVIRLSNCVDCGQTIADVLEINKPLIDQMETSVEYLQRKHTIHEKELKISTRLIGDGTFGEVFEATWNGKTVAAKIFNNFSNYDITASLRERGDHAQATHEEHVRLQALQHSGRQAIEQVYFEVALAKSLRHTNVAQAYGVFDAVFEPPHSGVICVLIEYADRGSLAKFIWLPDDERGLSYSCRTRIALEMVNALEYLHSKKIIVQNLKPENVLLFGSELHVKITDFCVFRYLEETMVPKEAVIFSPKYVAPEILRDVLRFTTAVDTFSLAMIFFELFTMEIVQAPPMGASAAEILAAREEMGPPVFPRRSLSLPVTLRAVIEKSWAQKPGERAKLRQIRDALNEVHIAIIRNERAGIKNRLLQPLKASDDVRGQRV